MTLDDRLSSAYQRRLTDERSSFEAAGTPPFRASRSGNGYRVLAAAAVLVVLGIGVFSIMNQALRPDEPTVRLETETMAPFASDDGGGEPGKAGDAENGSVVVGATPTPTSAASPTPVPTATPIPPGGAPAGSATSATVQPEAGSDGPTSTPDPESTPAPDASVVPTETVEPDPTVTPDPTLTPEATATPGPTATPRPTPEPTVSPTPTNAVPPAAGPIPTAVPTPEPTSTPVPTATPTPEPTATPVPTPTPTYAPGVANSVCPSGRRASLEFAALRYVGPNTGWGRLDDLVDEQDGPYYFEAWEPNYPDPVSVEVTLADPVRAIDIRVAQDPFTPVSGSIGFEVDGETFSIALAGVDGWRVHPFAPSQVVSRFVITRTEVGANIMEVLICVEA